jgi:hypothetical protein
LQNQQRQIPAKIAFFSPFFLQKIFFERVFAQDGLKYAYPPHQPLAPIPDIRRDFCRISA